MRNYGAKPLLQTYPRALLKRVFQLSAALPGVLASPAMAQSSVPPMPGPPVYTTIDDNGVDLTRGNYTPSIELVSIGPSDNPLSHMFTGNMAFSNLSGSINTSSGVIGTTTYTFYKVSVNGVSAIFLQPPGNPAIFSYIGSQGQSLVFNSSTQQYTYTDLNKVVTVFSKTLGGHVAATANEAGIVSRTYPSGEVLTYSYVADPSGFQQLRQVSSNRGYAIRYEFSGVSTISKITAYNMSVDYCDVNASSCTFSRNWPSVTITSQNTGYPNYAFTDQMGRVSSVVWNANGATLQTPTGRQATLVNDSAGRVASFSSGSSTWSYSYSTNSTWFIAAVTDPLGQTRTTTTDTSIGRPIFLPDSAAGSITMGYDQSGNLSVVTYPEGNSTGYTRDSRSNVTRVGSNAKPGSGQASVATTSGFDASCTTPSCNKPNWTADANGNQTDYTYDPVHGGVLTETLPAATTGGIRPQTRYGYSQVPTYAKSSTGTLVQIGSIWTTTDMSKCATTASCAGTADETKTIISYAGSNNLQPTSITVKSGDGSIVSTETRSYDPNGDVLTVDGPLAGTGDTTTYRYNADRETVGVISPDPDGTTGLRKQHAIRTTYNADGQPTLVEVGTVTGTDDTAWAAFSSQQQMVTTYDASGRKATDAVTSGGTTYGLTQFSYDADGRLDCTALRMNTVLWGSLPSSACTAQTASTAGPDRITKYAYDSIGRRTNVTTGFGTPAPVSKLTTTYTGNGKTASEADGNGNVTNYAYDGLDRLLTTTYAGGSYEQFGYDANGSLTSQRLRDGTSISYAYDNRGRLISKILPNGETGATYNYDLLDRVLSVTQGTTVTYVWDTLNRLKSETQPFGSMAYQYDAGGNRTRLTWQDGFYVSYSYDTASELTAIRENGSTDLATFTYDDLGRRISLTRGNGVTTTYSYDPVSRLNGLNNDLSGTADDQNTIFIYNSASQIASATRSNTSYNYTNSINTNRAYATNGLNQYTSAGTTSFSYDARGNLTTSAALTYGYTSENLLKTAPGGVSLYYDASGRLSEYDTSVSTRFVYDADQIVAEVANPTGAIQKRYVFGPGTDEPLVEYDASGTKTYLVADERGSVIARSNASGTAAAKNTYDEYGIPGASNQGRFQYTGQVWLTDIGVAYYKARIYSPTLGRFLQTDPIGYGDGLNWYNYVHDDPINGIDPTGLRDICYMVDAGGYTTTKNDEITVVKIQNCIRFPDDGLPFPIPLPPVTLTKAQYDKMCFTSGGWDKFFRDQSDPVQKLGTSRNVDPLLLLGLANLESQHGNSYAYRNRQNPFGATPQGDSTAGLKYSSFAAAWSHWDSQWGPRIQGVGSDADKFTSQLLLDNRLVKGGIDTRGSYNSENPNWASTVKKTTADAAKRYTKWRDNGCGS